MKKVSRMLVITSMLTGLMSTSIVAESKMDMKDKKSNKGEMMHDEKMHDQKKSDMDMDKKDTMKNDKKKKGKIMKKDKMKGDM